MTFPAFLFALLVSSLLGALYHLIRGGGLGRLVLYIVLAWAGFAGGYLVGRWITWPLFPLGPIDYGFSPLGSLLLLLIGDWISRINLQVETFPDDENEV